MMKLPRAFSAPFFFFLGFIFFTEMFLDSFTGPKLLILFCTCFCLVFQRKLTWRGPSKYLPILLLWPLASLFWAVDPVKGALWIAMSVLAAFPLLFFIHPEHESEGNDPRFRYKKAVLIAAILVSAHGLLVIVLEATNWTFLKSTFLLGTDSLMGNPWLSDHFSVLALWFLPFNIDWGPISKRTEIFQWKYAGCSLMIIYIVCSGSKTAVFGLFVWFLSQIPGRHLFSMAGVLIVTIVLASGAFWWSRQPDGFIESVISPDDYLAGYDQQSYIIAKRGPLYRGKTHSLISRIILFKNTIEMIKTRPFTGFGAGQFETQYPRFSQSAHRDPNMNGWYRPISPHNFLLANSVGLGLFWSVLLLGLMIQFGKQLSCLKHRIAWVYFMATAMWQPLYLCYPILFIFLLAPSKPHSAGPQNNMKNTYLAISCLFALLWSTYQFAEGYSYSAQNSQDISELFPFRKGEVLYREGDVAMSHFYFKKALKNDPYSPEALYNFLQTMSFEHLDLKTEGLHLFRQCFPYFRASCVSEEMRVKESTNLSDPLLELRYFLMQHHLLEDKSLTP